MKCRLCGKNAHQAGGWLARVNEKGVAGVWECRPNCASKLTPEEAILGAIEPPPSEADGNGEQAA